MSSTSFTKKKYFGRVADENRRILGQYNKMIKNIFFKQF